MFLCFVSHVDGQLPSPRVSPLPCRRLPVFVSLLRPSWQDEHKKAIDRVTKEIVESYESELVRLRREATEAHNVARQVGTSDDAAGHVCVSRVHP